MLKRIAVMLLLAAAVVGGYLLVRRLTQTAKQSDLLTVSATIGPIEQTVMARGRLEPAEVVNVGAQVSGQVKSLFVVLGQTVHAGDPIAEIDSLPQQNALRIANDALVTIRAQKTARLASLRLATLAFRRQSEMLAGDATSHLEYETAEATLASARADVEGLDAQIRQAETAVDMAQVNMGYTRIVSPINGVVIAVITKQGQTVNSSLQTPSIVVLARLSTMVIKAQISEADVTRVRPGLPVYFTILGAPNHRYHATLRQIEPAPVSIATDPTVVGATAATSTNPTAIYYNGLFDVPNPHGELRTAMTAEVHIKVASVKSALRIPSSALGQKNQNGLYTIQLVDAEGNLSIRSVRIGINNRIEAEVLEGLSPVDRVVLGDGINAVKEDSNAPFSLPY